MENLPPIVNSKAFWEAATTAVAGVLALLAFLGYVDTSWAIPASVMLTWIFSFLRLFGITPELRAQLIEKRLERAEKLLKEASILRNDLLGVKEVKVSARRTVNK